MNFLSNQTISESWHGLRHLENLVRLFLKKLLGIINFYNFAVRLQSNDRWCNGSTADFGSACLGSNPSRSTK